MDFLLTKARMIKWILKDKMMKVNFKLKLTKQTKCKNKIEKFIIFLSKAILMILMILLNNY